MLKVVPKVVVPKVEAAAAVALVAPSFPRVVVARCVLPSAAAAARRGRVPNVVAREKAHPGAGEGYGSG